MGSRTAHFLHSGNKTFVYLWTYGQFQVELRFLHQVHTLFGMFCRTHLVFASLFSAGGAG